MENGYPFLFCRERAVSILAKKIYTIIYNICK